MTCENYDGEKGFPGDNQESERRGLGPLALGQRVSGLPSNTCISGGWTAQF